MKHGDAGRDRSERFARNVDRRLSRLDRIEQIADNVQVLMRAVLAIAEFLTAEGTDMSERGDALVAKVREKKSAWDSLVVARNELRKKLDEARAAPDMGGTNAKIDEAIAMLDQFVDTEGGTSPILANTEVDGEQPAEIP